MSNFLNKQRKEKSQESEGIEEKGFHKKTIQELEGKKENLPIIEVLKKIKDPELNLDIWTLELIYDIKRKENKNVEIEMTFTSPMCPYGPQLLAEVKENLKKIGFDSQIELTFNPLWQPSESVKEMLGIF
mgnify:CR=1 FL=1